MAHNLQQAITAILGEMQVCRDASRGNELRNHLLRVDARLSVLERISWRRGVALPVNGQDSVSRLALEKMADAVEEAATAWTEAKATNGRNVLAGAMLEVGVRFAGAASREGILRRYVRGPYAGLAALANAIVNGQDCIEMKDAPALAALVHHAREIPAREEFAADAVASNQFRQTLAEFVQTLDDRVRDERR